MRVFVTGASGFIGSAIVKELLGAGHQVLGLARSDASAKAVSDAGAEVLRGDVTDLDSLRLGVQQTDGTIHTAFIHDFSKFAENCEIDRQAVLAMGDAIANTGKPLIVTSGTGLLSGLGKPGTEDDLPPANAPIPRIASEHAAAAASEKGAKVSVVRLPPSVHGDGDHGFVPALIAMAREKGIAGYLGEGKNLWPAVHRFDAANLYRLILESGAQHPRYHAIHDEGVPFKEIAEVMGKKLDLPTQSIAAENAGEHFGWMAHFAAMDSPASGTQTKAWTGWKPIHEGLIDDLENGTYFQ